MDYKTNILSHEVKASEALLPEVNGLYFALLPEDKAVFDSTAYYANNDINEVDYHVFMRTNKKQIELIAKASGKKTTELFYQNTDGHILIASELTFIFLAFANQEMFLYFNHLISDVMTNGMAFSDSYIYGLALTRMPSDILQDIISSRNTDETGNEQQSDTDSGV